MVPAQRLTTIVRLAASSTTQRLAPDIDASGLLGRELEMRKLRLAHGDVELTLLVSEALAHRRGELPRVSIH